jgi:catechol 2,3-dioxygenase-like lactoylglutathione lyase family enzyme
MNTPLTKGCHHIGLTVSNLEESAGFFTDILGWKEVRRDQAYPAIFVTDGTIMVTLWETQTLPNPFNKNQNVGLHHVAFTVDSEQQLTQLYNKLHDSKVPIEFEPELLREGPAKHMMCFEPSGIRVEFIWLGSH